MRLPMMFVRYKKLILLSAIIVIAGIIFFLITSHQEIDYITQVKPIINKKCISCHGGVRQQANFSLLFRDWALKKCKSGKYAIIPGDPNHSELIRRITSNDPEHRMPYHHEPLTKNE